MRHWIIFPNKRIPHNRKMRDYVRCSDNTGYIKQRIPKLSTYLILKKFAGI